MSLHKPLILVTRANMQEDMNTIAYLQKRKRCDLIDWNDMSDFKITEENTQKILEKMKTQTSKDQEENSEKVVNAIVTRNKLV